MSESMTRRGVLAALLAVVAADLSGTARKRRDDARCQRMARARLRRGLTDRERAQLDRQQCVEVNGEWVSGRFYQA